MALLEPRAHGAMCCGMAHIKGFNNFHRQDIDILQHKVRSLQGKATRKCRAIEAIVTGSQLRRYPLIRTGLEEAGFRHSFSFVNKNSGNKCHVYHWYRDCN